MNILFVAPQLGKGGAEDIIVNMTSYFAENNRVSLFLFKRTQDDLYNLSRLPEGVEVISLFNNSFKHHSNFERLFVLALYALSPFIALYLYFRFRFYKFDIMHFNMTLSSFYLPLFKLIKIITPKAKTKFIETFHTNWHLLKWFNKLIFSISWSCCDAVVYEIGSDEIKNIKKFSFAKNVHYIPFGVENGEDVDTDYLNYFTNKYLKESMDNKFVLMSIARLRMFEKKLDQFIAVLAEVKKKTDKDFHYIICGDGPDRRKLEELISAYALKSNVTITGYVDRPQQLAIIPDLFLAAMVEHSTGIAGLQAGMAGTAVLGYQTSNKYNGHNDSIFSSYDIDVLSNKIISLMDEDYLEHYRAQSTGYIVKTFNFDKFTHNYNQLFIKLVCREK
ncbi:glycosyltransferase family 4 protein [Shewanella sp. D64]|uniref:glycosyltransferase family 4 protein n=1 Tax=unclassified Shewanella TaxID=196818 RepID=UPI0022BA513F|nr:MULTISPECIES: glycosyltransferase family 4 protein [unclassified Shewanella]MEC4727738.1 glycosyltransferase family 4 protein [Shewanella sp. D64]MEC4737501.1 glycosyltransferase family 4 protein [Shewanella sp. E94]WBJ97311.1 glycosyltransferase family 4 protein [Shewanella sp. MTB7]